MRWGSARRAHLVFLGLVAGASGAGADRLLLRGGLAATRRVQTCSRVKAPATLDEAFGGEARQARGAHATCVGVRGMASGDPWGREAQRARTAPLLV